MTRTHWNDLPGSVRRAVEQYSGPVTAAETVTAGRNSALAAAVHTSRAGRVFLKGARRDHRQAATQRVEAEINPHVRPVAPQLLWHLHVDGWDLLGFEHVAGRPVDLSPASRDLPAVAAALVALAALPAPPLPLRRIEDRWAEYGDPAMVQLLRGDTLLHTDLHPENMLTDGHRVAFVDWAWPTLGAAWIDTAILTLWMLALGHSVSDAEAWAQRNPAWPSGCRGVAVDSFTTVTVRLWDDIATADPQPWKRRLAAAAHRWDEHRRNRSCSPAA